MKLCFVSENGPRETYFVDEPRITFIFVVPTILLSLLTFSILYATTPDDGFELAETCSDIRV
jgi:hypothetical protein